MQPRLQKKHDFMLILIPSFIVIVAWIIFHIYNSAVSSTITTTQNALISPISPNFDMSVLTTLSQRDDVIPLSHIDIATPGSPTDQEGTEQPFVASSSPTLISPVPSQPAPTVPLPSLSLPPSQTASSGGVTP
jgi:hypothetical protein